MAKPTLHFQRFEFKYFLPRHYVRQLVAALLPHMEWDPYAKAQGGFYRVNSLYFDSPDYGCFWDKEAGVADRKKLRFRYYGDKINTDTPVFAEIKRKQDALTIKDRIALLAKDTHGPAFERTLNQLAKVDASNEFLQEIRWFRSRNAMRAKLLVSYDRRALVGMREKKFRVTIDENIKTSLQSELGGKSRLTRKVYPHGVVFEVKYNNVLPAWFHRVLQTFELQRLAYSKYCNSLRLVIPQFNDNNYQLTY
ncbi:MAG: polyphosphate polymerase domain-containing protein [bacterium]|nr:polyphosphate polymerase domain-containing protein [bacterium]